MNKNTVLAWATFIMVFVGLGLIALGIFRYKLHEFTINAYGVSLFDH